MARSLIHQVLERWGLPDIERRAALLVSELVTNSVRHSHSPEIELQIHQREGNAVRIEVFDRSPEPPVPRLSGSDKVSGRGLSVVAAISAAWGVDQVPGDGKWTWAELTLG